jgi:hypothetical protein
MAPWTRWTCTSLEEVGNSLNRKAEPLYTKGAAGLAQDSRCALAHGVTFGAENGITKNAAAFTPIRLMKRADGTSSVARRLILKMKSKIK